MDPVDWLEPVAEILHIQPWPPDPGGLFWPVLMLLGGGVLSGVRWRTDEARQRCHRRAAIECRACLEWLRGAAWHPIVSVASGGVWRLNRLGKRPRSP
jgi:hypothetical protein